MSRRSYFGYCLLALGAISIAAAQRTNIAPLHDCAVTPRSKHYLDNSATKDPLNFPPQLNNKLRSLLAVVETGDFRPTGAWYAVFKELHAELQEQITSLDRLLIREVPALTRLSRRQG